MELPLLLFVLVSLCRGEDPYVCRGPCPEFTVVGNFQGFEERLYNASEWITTEIKSTETSDFLEARSRLKNVADYLGSWPVLITVTNEHKLRMSWFVPPGTTKPESTDQVTLQSRPEVTVYVRVFGGFPSIDSGEENNRMLCELLNEAGKTCTEGHTFMEANYDPYLALTHHNEIWIDETQ